MTFDSKQAAEQMSVGFQAGLQDYSQLIVFENLPAMDKFMQNPGVLV